MKNSNFRKDFPMLRQTMQGKPLIYLDTAATALKPQVVIDTLNKFYSESYGTVHRAIYDLSAQATQAYEEVREKVRQFLNANSCKEILFTKGTTDAINLVASSFGKAFLKPGDEIIISEMEHHSNIVPWQMACEERGASLKVIPITDQAELNLEAYVSLLSNKTKLVAVAHIANATGTINPIKQIIKMAHEKGAKVLVDGAQAAPHLNIDVQELNADFYTFSGHKIYGPTGVGVLYGREELLEQMPPRDGGGDMIEKVCFTKTTFNQLPLKFEAGTPAISPVIALGAAIDYLKSIGFENIQKQEHQLMELATEQLKIVPGLRIIGPTGKKAAIISFTIEGVHALDIGTMLDLRGIAIRTGHLCAQPTMRRFNITSCCRISFGLYNQSEEIIKLVSHLKEIIKLLK